MTFTRLSDDTELEPITVFGPFEQARQGRNIVRQVLESAQVRIAYRPTGYRRGEYQLLFHTYSDAREALDWFTAESLYRFEGPTVVPGEYIIVDGMVVESDGTQDATFSMRFVVDGEGLSIRQNEPKWELLLPYQEVPE